MVIRMEAQFKDEVSGNTEVRVSCALIFEWFDSHEPRQAYLLIIIIIIIIIMIITITIAIIIAIIAITTIVLIINAL